MRLEDGFVKKNTLFVICQLFFFFLRSVVPGGLLSLIVKLSETVLRSRVCLLVFLLRLSSSCLNIAS